MRRSKHLFGLVSLIKYWVMLVSALSLLYMCARRRLSTKHCRCNHKTPRWEFHYREKLLFRSLIKPLLISLNNWLVLQLVVCSSDAVVSAIGAVSGRGVRTSRGGGVVSECITITLVGVLGLCHSIWAVHRSTCVRGIVAWANGTSSGHLSISRVMDLLVALPEWSAASTGGVVVRWRWAIALLFLVVADEEDLENGRDKEEEDVDDGDGEDGCLESAGTTQVRCVGDVLTSSESESIRPVPWRLGVRGPTSKNCVHVAAARASSMAVEPGNRHIAAYEADVQDDSEEGEEADSAQEEGEEHSEEQVEHRGARHALNGSDPVMDGQLVICEDGEEVGEDAESDDATS